MGAPLPDQGTALNPAAPTGWQYHPIDGAICRDGSPMGIFVHKGTSAELLIYFEGGGACSNKGFCLFNPKNQDWILDGDGSSVLGTAAGAVNRRQQPGGYSGGTPAGIFDTANAANPFKDYSIVYVPYCTGDVHFGTKANATVPGTHDPADPRSIATHQFMGSLNTKKIIGRVYPTFSSATRVVVAGSSAGSFGAALNFSMIQDTFGNTPVTAVLDSGIPFDDQYMPACMQSKWRSGWGLDLPPDCTECQQADGGGLLGMADFLQRKHPNAKLAIISTMEDEVIRLFFSVGLNNCANFDAGDPVAIFLQTQPYMPPATYSSAMTALRTQYQATNKLGTFFMPGLLHQHIFRPTFYTATAGGKTMAQFVTEFLAGTVAQLGP